MQMQELTVGILSGTTLRFVNTCLSSGHIAATIILLLLLLVVGCFVFSVFPLCKHLSQQRLHGRYHHIVVIIVSCWLFCV
jgi:hypothetical protein